MGAPRRIGQRLVWAVSLVLIFVLPVVTVAQEISPALLRAAREAYEQEQQAKSTPAFAARSSMQIASAATKGAWVNLSHLPVGTYISVETRDNRTHQGHFRGWSEQAITMQEARSEVTYRREEVFRVKRPGPRNRARAAKIGFGLGLLAGAVAGLAIGASRPRDEDTGLQLALFSLATGGVAGGAAASIAALAAPRHETVIYQSSP